jgi:F-type H+-transporting ATPase subunit b
LRKHLSLSRSFGKLITFFLLAAALFAGAATATKPLAAQQPDVTDQSDESHADPSHIAVQEEKKEVDVYRHASIVQAVGRKFGMDPETTAKVFEAINFLIILLAIVIPVMRILPRVLRKRTETLNHDIETARAATADANARLSAVEAKLAGLDSEIQKFRKQIEQESLEDEKRIKATIEEESARIVAAAEQEITQATAQARRELRHLAADLAIEQAEKQLVLTPEVDQALIDEFISGVASNGATKGGSK